MISDDSVIINGDGKTSRNFSYVHSGVQANLFASFAPSEEQNEVNNVAVGARTSLNELFAKLRSILGEH